MIEKIKEKCKTIGVDGIEKLVVFNSILKSEDTFEEKFGNYIDEQGNIIDLEEIKTAWTDNWGQWWQKQVDNGNLEVKQ